MDDFKTAKLSLRIRRHENSADIRVSTAYLLRYAQEMRVFALGYGSALPKNKLIDFLNNKPSHVIPVVKAQHLESFKELFNGTDITMIAKLTSLGNSTIGLQTNIYDKDCNTIYTKILVILVMKDLNTQKAWKINPTLKEQCERLLQSSDISNYPTGSLAKAIDIPKLPIDPSDKNYFQYKFKIRYSDLDLNKHVNHARYCDFIDDARYSEEAKKTFLNSQYLTLPIQKISIEYIREVFLDQNVVLVLWFLKNFPESNPTLGVCLYKEEDNSPVNVSYVTLGNPPSKI